MLMVKYKFLISGNEYMQVSFTETGNILRDLSIRGVLFLHMLNFKDIWDIKVKMSGKQLVL